MNKNKIVTGLFFSFCSAGFGTAQAVAEQAGANVYMDATVLAYSETMPIEQLLDELVGPEPEAGTIAFTFNQAEIGATYGRATVSVFARYDYLLEFSEDAMAVAYADGNNIAFPTGSLNIDIRPNHIQARGLGFSYQFDLPRGISLTPRINYLKSDSLTVGYLRGTLEGESEDDFDGVLELDYAYEEDLILDREPEDVSGEGYAIDLFASWSITDKWQVQANVKDAFSEITWKDVTYTEASATTNTISFDEEGRLQSVAALTGREFYRDEKQELPVKTRVDLNYQLTDHWQLQAGMFRVADFETWRVSWAGVWKHFFIVGGYQFETEAYELAFGHRYFNLSFTADSTDLEQAKMLGVSLSLSVPVF